MSLTTPSRFPSADTSRKDGAIVLNGNLELSFFNSRNAVVKGWRQTVRELREEFERPELEHLMLGYSDYINKKNLLLGLKTKKEHWTHNAVFDKETRELWFYRLGEYSEEVFESYLEDVYQRHKENAEAMLDFRGSFIKGLLLYAEEKV